MSEVFDPSRLFAVEKAERDEDERTAFARWQDGETDGPNSYSAHQ
jgi:hypothetical protein